jgi:hypothetical protein
MWALNGTRMFLPCLHFDVYAEFKTFLRQRYVLLLTNLTHTFVICIFQFYVIRLQIASITDVIAVINISLKTR